MKNWHVGLAWFVAALIGVWYFFLREQPLYVTREGFTKGSGGIDDYLRDQAVSADVTVEAYPGPERYIANLPDYLREEE